MKYILFVCMTWISVLAEQEHISSPFVLKKNAQNRSVLRDAIIEEFEALEHLIPDIIQSLAKILRQLDKQNISMPLQAIDHEMVQMDNLIRDFSRWIEQFYSYSRNQNIQNKAPLEPKQVNIHAHVSITHAAIRAHIANLLDALSILLTINQRIITSFLAHDKTMFILNAQAHELHTFNTILSNTYGWLQRMHEQLKVI